MRRYGEKQVRKELEEARRELQLFPQTWPAYERVARCLYWLDEPESQEYFRSAASAYRPRSGDVSGLISVGNYYRLVGEPGHAGAYLERAREILRQSLGDRYYPDVCRMMECSFLLGEYDTVEQLAGMLRPSDNKAASRSSIVQALARARRTGDEQLASDVVRRIEALIRKYRVKASAIAYLSLWDWYEIALLPVSAPAPARAEPPQAEAIVDLEPATR